MEVEKDNVYLRKLKRLQQYRIDQLRGHGFYAEMFNDFNIFKKNYEQIPDLF